MSNTFKLRSNDIKKLNEVLQKLTISEGAEIVKNPLLEADGKFTSIINMNKDFNHDIVNDVDVEEEKSEKELLKKAHLVDEVKSKLRQALENNKEISEILKKIEKINSDTKENEWVLNEKQNTALLKDKNAEIFKQNNNLCLSINDDIRLFGSVRELHDWLIAHNLPVPKGITLSEAIEEKPEDSDKTKPWHKKGYMYKQNRVDSDYQAPEVKQAMEKVNRLQELMSKKDMNDTNALLASVFNADRSIENQIDTPEDEVEECVTTGDLGMATTYLADKKDESTLEEDKWEAPEVFGLLDDKGARMKYASIIDGSRAVLKSLANDTAFGLEASDKIQMTKDELDHWKKLAEAVNYMIRFAIPAICKKMANDYVNESIEKNKKRGSVADEELIPEIKQNVKNIFGYDLTDDQVAAMLKRNSKGKGIETMDPAMLRTPEQENIVTQTKLAMAKSKELRENVADEIFNKSSMEARNGYAKYKKFVELANKKGAIKVVKSHAPVVNQAPQATPSQKPQKDPAELIYKALFDSDVEKAKEIISTLDANSKEEVKAQLLNKNPMIGSIIDPLFKESVEEPSLGKAFLSSIEA